MSEISVISNQYKTVVNTTDKVNNSIIALKKRSIANSRLVDKTKIQLTAYELEFAKTYLLKFLLFLQKLQEEIVTESAFLPKVIIKDFQNRIINSIPFFDVEVKKLVEDINHDNNLEKEQFNLLDKMASTLDSERTVLFRKLRTARG